MMAMVIYQRNPIVQVDMAASNAFDWQLYPETEAFLSGLVQSFLKCAGYADIVRREIESTSSTRFIDWVDSMEVPKGTVNEEDLSRLGYLKEPKIGAAGSVYVHPGAFFPLVVGDEKFQRLSLKVENLERFLAAGHLSHKKIEGEQNAPFRWAELNREGDRSFQAVERHGDRSFELVPATDVKEYLAALNVLSSRKRTFRNDADGMEELRDSVVALGDKLARPRLVDAFFRAERTYWQSKNRAGLVQFKRQELLGLGWGNHDHHTFRCSRENFGRSIAIFEEMGLTRRERFFAGAEAGWGAQVMEQPDSGLVVFADVDLGPDEVNTDFTNQGLRPLDKMGTVGLWVGLHGESVLDSGMHHLAVGSDFQGMRDGLKAREVASMNPFSNFDFLKQSFTEAERWTPPKDRVDRLLKSKLISEKNASRFTGQGAVGSHLEIIQRDRGFKGFNQSSVSAIIRMTDPLRRSENGA
jgi:hypothetical protein